MASQNRLSDVNLVDQKRNGGDKAMASGGVDLASAASNGAKAGEGVGSNGDGDYDANAQANNASASNFLGLGGGKRRLSRSNKQAKSNENFIGVPPGMTESSHRRQEPGDFEDEEEEDDAHNNFLTQAELFKSYAE